MARNARQFEENFLNVRSKNSRHVTAAHGGQLHSLIYEAKPVMYAGFALAF